MNTTTSQATRPAHQQVAIVTGASRGIGAVSYTHLTLPTN